MYEFNWPWLGLIWPVPLLLWWLRKPFQAQLQRLRVATVPAHAEQSLKAADSRISLLLALLIWTSLVLAAMQPTWFGEPIATRNEAREMMLAVDLSGSMEIADMELNGNKVDRLTMVKAVLSDFIERRNGDRLGLILFADTAYVQAPMTYDRETVKQLLDESSLRLIGERTAIGDAVALAVKRFQQHEDTNNIVILLTDGQNTAGAVSPEQALQLAQYNDVKIYAIGVGAEEVIVDGFFGQRRINPSRDLDEAMLQGFAEATGGRYFRARSTTELAEIYQLLDEYEPIAGDEQMQRPQVSLFHWPLACAWLLALLWMSWFGLRRRR
ncbi:vWA domain-containing protein [Pseudidiomarina taiwanensis]|uniref:IMP dehydrogenase n=1 Tax=Pseudidiomarina taiwanensis TaxID=337250 RepID=A0A432ZK35_9GAMM|nr:VWA domain-containing protein [Pseudidiomarina taiwanensis]RUO78244.1 IMP dehydrogenase [Pseudidiomarina taiwanensis]